MTGETQRSFCLSLSVILFVYPQFSETERERQKHENQRSPVELAEVTVAQPLVALSPATNQPDTSIHFPFFPKHRGLTADSPTNRGL